MNAPEQNVELVQSGNFPNTWSLQRAGECVQIFVDRIDPRGSFATERAREYAAEHGLRIVATNGDDSLGSGA